MENYVILYNKKSVYTPLSLSLSLTLIITLSVSFSIFIRLSVSLSLSHCSSLTLIPPHLTQSPQQPLNNVAAGPVPGVYAGCDCRTEGVVVHPHIIFLDLYRTP